MLAKFLVVCGLVFDGFLAALSLCFGAACSAISVALMLLSMLVTGILLQILAMMADVNNLPDILSYSPDSADKDSRK